MSNGEITGTIDKIWINKNNYVLVIDGERYSDLGTPPAWCEEGKQVLVRYTENGPYKNIAHMEEITVETEKVVDNSNTQNTTSKELKAIPGTVSGMVFKLAVEQANKDNSYLFGSEGWKRAVKDNYVKLVETLQYCEH